MKKLLVSLGILLMTVFLSGCAVEARPKPDYLAEMVTAAVNADHAAGRAAQLARREELTASGETEVDFETLLLLARFLYACAGDTWRTEELRLCAGEVLLNRVDSPEFPDTLEEVLCDEGIGLEELASLTPSRDCVNAALRLLQGERLLDRAVVYQSDRALGGGVYATFCDRRLRFTYFCLTEHPELYS